MDSFEINKIITAVLLVVLLVFGVGKISDLIFEVKKPDIDGYKVEVNVEGATATQASSESQVDIATLLALGDGEHGKKVFKKCAACHSVNQGGKNKIGPKLWNVMFRPVGSVTDYKYSKALSVYKKDWNWEEINGFLIKIGPIRAHMGPYGPQPGQESVSIIWAPTRTQVDNNL